ncbi:MAG: ACT domain-containing protein, partial [Rhodospirillaceae bacterium]
MSEANPSPQFARTYILKLSCPDRMGIVAAVASFLNEQGCNIEESAQFDDDLSGQFFMRTVFGAGDATPDMQNLSAAFGPIATRFSMDWSMHDIDVKPRVMILVSKPGHCLN